VLVASGVAPEHAALVAESLVAANLRGVDSHGIHLLVSYLDQIHAGDVDVAAVGQVAVESGALMVYDGCNGLGQVVSSACVGHAIRLAAEHGLGMVTSRESNHFGAAAFWAMKIAETGKIGLAFCNASPIVPPWQGKEGRFGTNPICMAVPVGARDPTTDTEAAYKGLLMPLGGYKGSGLAMMVEILCGAISGGAMSTQLGGLRVRGKRVRNSQTFIAIDVGRVQPDFRERVDWLIGEVKGAAPAAGYEEVLVANEPELRMERERLRSGIPVADGTYEGLLAAAVRVGVTERL
jgi:LDH2 family malate/lactate/ureidoglycolate dehydrogenase